MLNRYNLTLMKYLIVWIMALHLTVDAKPLLNDEQAAKFSEKVNDEIEVIRFEFGGHTYICFWYIPNCAGNGWVHDPDCKKCKGDKK